MASRRMSLGPTPTLDLEHRAARVAASGSGQFGESDHVMRLDHRGTLRESDVGAADAIGQGLALIALLLVSAAIFTQVIGAMFPDWHAMPQPLIRLEPAAGTFPRVLRSMSRRL